MAREVRTKYEQRHSPRQRNKWPKRIEHLFTTKFNNKLLHCQVSTWLCPTKKPHAGRVFSSVMLLMVLTTRRIAGGIFYVRNLDSTLFLAVSSQFVHGAVAAKTHLKVCILIAKAPLLCQTRLYSCIYAVFSGFGAKANKMWFCSQNTVFDGLTILGKFASPDQKYVSA